MQKTEIKKYLIFIFLICSFAGYSQKEIEKLTITSEAGVIVSNSNTTPFLLRSNQYGLVPLQSQIVYINGAVKREYDSVYTFSRKLKPISYGYGGEFHTNIGMANQLFLPQLYGKIRYKAFEFYAGRRKEIQGLVDTTGTMGSYIWSGNALPIPKIQISIPNFVPIIKNGLLSIKGNYAHGWFGSSDSVKHYFLHQKSLYIRLGKPNWRFKFYGGINHQAQWGGKPAVPFYDKISNQTISTFGNDFKTYLDVVSGLSMAGGGKTISNQPGVAANEASNRSGNHLGTVDLGIEYVNDNFRILAYRQSIFEDGSLFYLNNISDGLLGLSYKNLKGGFLRNICLEYLNTTNQGGEHFLNYTSELRGRDNYFNNTIYKDSWVYKNNVIGNPLFFTEKEYELNNNQNSNYIINNRIQALSVSVKYMINNVELISKIINSENLGNYDTLINLYKTTFSNSAIFRLNKKSLIKVIFNNEIGNIKLLISQGIKCSFNKTF